MCLPNTCFMFTDPILSNLKKGGDFLHENLDRNYLKLFIHILAYSFEDDEKNFNETIQLY